MRIVGFDKQKGATTEAKGKSRSLRDDNNKCNGKGKVNSDSNGKSGFLRCAPDDEAVRCFGRNDKFVVLVREKQATTEAKQKQIPAG